MKPLSELLKLTETIKNNVPNDLQTLLDQRDGAAKLALELPKCIKPSEASEETKNRRVWELCGLHYSYQNRFHEAILIFEALYSQILIHQENTMKWSHKGMPLVWISDCHANLGHTLMAKRYLLLTVCEDAIREKGRISPESTGVYFRAVWNHGMPHQELNRYATKIWTLFQSGNENALYPEWILQHLDDEWLTFYPSASEAMLYTINRKYVACLLGKLGAGDGKDLELLAHYLLGAIPGFRAYMRTQSQSTDYDVICAIEGPSLDYRSELGRYFLCECKDWNKPADVTAFIKFSGVLSSAKCHFGIIFSKKGISGEGKTKTAAREQLKVYQSDGRIVAVISHSDLERVANGVSFISILRAKYEKIRLDLLAEIQNQ